MNGSIKGRQTVERRQIGHDARLEKGQSCFHLSHQPWQCFLQVMPFFQRIAVVSVSLQVGSDLFAKGAHDLVFLGVIIGGVRKGPEIGEIDGACPLLRLTSTGTHIDHNLGIGNLSD